VLRTRKQELSSSTLFRIIIMEESKIDDAPVTTTAGAATGEGTSGGGDVELSFDSGTLANQDDDDGKKKSGTAASNEATTAAPSPSGDSQGSRRSRLPIVATFKDHFSLPVPTSRIRYRSNRDSTTESGDATDAGDIAVGGGGACRIIQIDDAQIVLEEDANNEVSIRKIHDTSEGVRALRVMYAIVVRCVYFDIVPNCSDAWRHK